MVLLPLATPIAVLGDVPPNSNWQVPDPWRQTTSSRPRREQAFEPALQLALQHLSRRVAQILAAEIAQGLGIQSRLAEGATDRDLQHLAS